MRIYYGPLASEYDMSKTVKARFRPWLEGKSPQGVLSCSFFARQRCVHAAMPTAVLVMHNITVPRRARIQGPWTFLSLNFRIKSNKEEEEDSATLSSRWSWCGRKTWRFRVWAQDLEERTLAGS